LYNIPILFRICSGAVAAFYIYRLVLEGKPQKDSNYEGEAGN